MINISLNQAALDRIDRLIELQVAANDKSWIWDYLPFVSSLFVAVLAAFLVHKLTEKRERDKSVFRIYRALIVMVDQVSEAAMQRWIAGDETNKTKRIREVTWRLNQIGSVLTQLETITASSRLNLSFSGPSILNCSIKLTSAMIQLRRNLTGDADFADPKKGDLLEKIVEVESAKGQFLFSLTDAIGKWEQKIPCDQGSTTL